MNTHTLGPWVTPEVAAEIVAALQRIADGQEMPPTATYAETVLRYQEIARAAIAKAGEQL